ncbi:hypothetical protein HYG86_15270 [Alkalicella caledoniensis]|uniref:Replication restart DNA helicase PriA n=1 Tax=Alkalicella caledoniensis TaxID=2731377 RepID=A0A7G9WBG7_ALKCA|nr:hypothetical protein [Alkalicella caledoniensis]QNO16029.1 hypothetical protein HYG86_15270 [Alkalicella caledoniensis]
MENTAVRTATDRFPCPSCGANIKFKPSEQSMVCPYCDNKIDIEKEMEDIKEHCFRSALENATPDWGTEKKVIHCDSCGADTVLDSNIASQFCPFCGSSHIIQDNKCSSGIAPETLIPFRVGKKDAEKSFLKWIKKRHFAPNALKHQYISHRLEGVYVPYWTYDSQTFSSYTAQAGTYYYVTETHWVTRDGKQQQVTRQVRKTRWRHTSGNYSSFFDDVLINGSSHVNHKIINKVQPFNLKELVHYKPEFLSGFITEKYSIGLKEGWSAAREEIDSSIRSGVTNQIAADEVRALSIKTQYNDITFKHLLLPVWISSYTYKGKLYQFMVNGQSGRVEGEAPISPWKVVGAIGGVVGFVALIVFLINIFS